MSASSSRRTLLSRGVSIADLERLWRLDSPGDRRPPQTRLLIRRISSDDVRLGVITVTIDDRPIQAELRYGETVTVPVNSGAHLVTITNVWSARQLLTRAQPGHALVVECGIGTRSRLWSMLLPERIRALNVWIEARPEMHG